MKAIKHDDGTWDVGGLFYWEKTFNEFCDMIKYEMPFKFARYGDGEFNCMQGKIGYNCDGHQYFPNLGAALIKSVEVGKKHNTVTGIQPLSISQPRYDECIAMFNDSHEIVNADVFHNASITRILPTFMDLLANRDTVLVANARMANLNFTLHDPTRLIVIPEKNCWMNYEGIKQKITIEDSKTTGRVFILCAGMMSEVIISDFRDSQNTFLDLGSVLDPYCGIISRGYHHKLFI